MQRFAQIVTEFLGNIETARRFTFALSLALAACAPPAGSGGSGGGQGADAGPAAPPPGPEINFACPDDAPAITNGMNNAWPTARPRGSDTPISCADPQRRSRR